MYLPGGGVALDTYIICIYHTGMQNGCREFHSNHDSPLNYNLTFAIASLPKVDSKFRVESRIERRSRQSFCKSLYAHLSTIALDPFTTYRVIVLHSK